MKNEQQYLNVFDIANGRTTLHHGDRIDVMRTLADNSIDSIVTDPPYELTGKTGKGGFMGKAWDASGIAHSVEMWGECMRVLKPGGHLLAFSGSRTYHRMTCAIEDAGFEIRDQIQWLYGSGFPKSLDVSKAINKAAGAQREVVGTRKVSESDLGQSSGWNSLDTSSGVYNYTAPATANAKLWEGWGTSLKPAHEPICVARKPLTGTVAANVLAHGTGALNVDASRIGDAKRWPANIIHDGSDLVEAEFALYGTRKTGDLKPYKRSNQAGCAALCRKKATLTARATAAARRASSTAQRLARQIAVPATIIQR